MKVSTDAPDDVLDSAESLLNRVSDGMSRKQLKDWLFKMVETAGYKAEEPGESELETKAVIIK